MKLGQRALERILYQIVGSVTIPGQSACITPQTGDVRRNLYSFHNYIAATSLLLRDDVPDLVDVVAGFVAVLLIPDA